MTGDPVHLVVVEVGRHVARIRLARRLLERAEMSAVSLGALQQGDVFQVRGIPLHIGQEVLQHLQVHLDMVHLGPSAGYLRLLVDRGIGDVGNALQVGELHLAVGRVAQIDLEPFCPGREIGSAPGHANNIPFGVGLEMLEHASSDRAQCADDKDFLLHTALHIRLRG
jgi:hypothetical protein